MDKHKRSHNHSDKSTHIAGMISLPEKHIKRIKRLPLKALSQMGIGLHL
jgi:hypothetical protein